MEGRTPVAALSPQLFRLLGKIQHYDWGTRGAEACIPQLLGIQATPDMPYAELWIGAHPTAPSEIVIDDKRFPLDAVIQGHPLEFLGRDVAARFGNTLPFLLKVLSAANALSIQTHPNKEQAKRLHALDPGHYPDDNHKPEIAIAIDGLTAMAGFRPVSEIVANIKRCPELRLYVGDDIIHRVLAGGDAGTVGTLIQELYGMILTRAGEHERLDVAIRAFVDRLSGEEALTTAERLIQQQYSVFGVDVGLFSFLFFNIIDLQPGQAIFTGAGVPHAYIAGNIIECMANSDNVVRGGLTGKFKDVDVLLEVMKFDFAPFDILNKERRIDAVVYRTTAEEFEVTGFDKTTAFEEVFASRDRPSIVLVMRGSLNGAWTSGGSRKVLNFPKGASFFVPAALPEWKVSGKEPVAFVVVTVP